MDVENGYDGCHGCSGTSRIRCGSCIRNVGVLRERRCIPAEVKSVTGMRLCVITDSNALGRRVVANCAGTRGHRTGRLRASLDGVSVRTRGLPAG